jgi:hypothetical protein
LINAAFDVPDAGAWFCRNHGICSSQGIGQQQLAGHLHNIRRIHSKEAP